MITVVPNQSQIQIALRNFLTSILPTNVAVVAGQDNRVAEPSGTDFVVMTAINRQRIETNVDTYADLAFVGNIFNNELTVNSMLIGTILPGVQIFFNTGGTGAIVVTNTIINQISGAPGGVGQYSVVTNQNIPNLVMWGGSETFLQPTKVTMQLDVHGPNSADNAQIISTLFRDQYSVDAFATYGYDVTPLYADDPKQIPFINAEQQFETRWIVEAELQANQIIVVPEQFASIVNVKLVEIL